MKKVAGIIVKTIVGAVLGWNIVCAFLAQAGELAEALGEGLNYWEAANRVFDESIRKIGDYCRS